MQLSKIKKNICLPSDPIEKYVLPTNLNPEKFRGYIEDQYSSKFHTFSTRISGTMGSSMTKKKEKFCFFYKNRNLLVDFKTPILGWIRPYIVVIFFISPHHQQKNVFYIEYRPQFIGVDGGKVYFHGFLYVISLHCHLTPTFLDKSRDILGSNHWESCNFYRKMYFFNTL